MKKLRNKITSLFLILALLFTMMPATLNMAYAEGNKVTATVRVETTNGTTLVPETEISMTQKELSSYGLSITKEPSFISPLHILAEYMSIYANGNASDNITVTSSGYVTKILGSSGGSGTSGYGDSGVGWMYCVNNEMPVFNESTWKGITEYEVEDGDEIVIYGTDSYAMDYYYSHFDKKTYKGETDEPLSITLQGLNTMEMMYKGKAEETPISDAVLLIDKIDENDGKAVTESEYKTDSNGKVEPIFSKAGTYVISASKEGKISKPFAKVTISLADPSNDEKYVVEDKNVLVLPSETSEDLTLPMRGASNKTSIKWTSADTAIITDNGKITRPNVGSPASITTMTALIKKGEISGTKDFSIKVLPYEESDISPLIDKIVAAFNTGNNRFTATQYDKNANKVDINLLESLQNKADSVVSGSIVTLVSSSNDNVAADGLISYNNSAKTGYVTLSIAISGISEERTISVRIPKKTRTAQEVIDEKAASITWDDIKKDNIDQDTVKTDLNFNRGSSTDAVVLWTTSDSDTIYDSYGTGRVIRPAYGEPDKGVTITAIVSEGQYMNIYGYPGAAEPRTVEMFVTVAAFTSEEFDSAKVDVDAVALNLKNEDIYNIVYVSDSSTVDLNNIKHDLSLNIKSSILSGASFEWSSSNPAIAINTYRGKVSVPDVGEADKSGKLYVTLTKNSYSKKVEFDTTVPAMTVKRITDEMDYLATVKDALSFDNIKGANEDSDNVLSTMSMVYRGYVDDDGDVTWGSSNVGENGAKITWETDDPDASYAYETIRPSLGDDDKKVTLTATIASQNITDTSQVPVMTKKITYTVLAYSNKLKGLDSNYGTLDKSFNPDVDSYKLKDIPYNINKIKLYVDKKDPTATITAINAREISDGVYEVEVDSTPTEVEFKVSSSSQNNTYKIVCSKESVPMTSLSLNYNELALQTENSEQLVAGIIPSYATDTEVEWITSNPEIASVSDNGLVEAISAGETTVTVKSKINSTVYASCKVTVSAKPLPKYHIISMSGKGGTLTASGQYSRGSSINYVYKPDSGYRVSSVYVDGREVPFDVKGGSHEFTDINSDHMIFVAFEKEPIVAEKAPTMPKSFAVKAQKKKAKLTWKKALNITKYQVAYKIKGNKKWKYKTVSANKKTITIKKLKANKKYQFKIRSFKQTNDKKVYSKWSKTRTVKIKK